MSYLINSVFLLFFLTNYIFSQTLDANVFSSSGNFFSNNKTLSSTLGEVVVYDFSQSNYDLHQGFQNIAADLVCSFDCVIFSQLINLPQGWSYWSTFLSPKDNNMEDIFSQINEDVIILKDQYGEVYWPFFGINGINGHNYGQGYQIKMNTNQTLTINGYKQINPTVSVNEDWNIFGCLYYEPVLIEESLAPVIENIILVKDENANVFWPYLSINTIDYIYPGEAYALKSNSDFNFTFLNNQIEESLRAPDDTFENSFYFKKPIITDKNMTLGFPYEVLKSFMKYGDEIAVFDSQNNLVGRQIFEDNNLAITVWGDDVFTEIKDGMVDLEPFKFIIWDSHQEKESEINVLNWLEGTDYYITNGINISGEIEEINNQIKLSFLNCFPNPLSKNTVINVEVLEDGLVEIYLIDNVGKRESLLNTELSSGLHNIDLSINKNPGLYYLSVEQHNNIQVIPITVIR